MTQDIGTGQTYTTWQAWEDSLPATTTEPEIGEGLAEEFTGALNLSGITTSAANYVERRAKAGARHDGRAHAVSGLGNCRTNHSGAVATIQANLNYCRVAWDDVRGPGNNGAPCLVVDNVSTSAIYIHHCLFHNDGASTSGLNVGILLDDGSAFVAGVYGNMVYGFGGDGIRIAAVDAGSEISGNTIAFCNLEGGGLAAGIRTNSDTDPNVRNNASFNNGNLDIRGTAGNLNYNATSDGTGDDEGANGLANLTITNQFVSGTNTYSTIDLRLKSGSALIGAGQDWSAVGFPDISLDITGATRTGTWDIGAHQFSAGGGTSFPVAPTPISYSNLTYLRM